MTYTAFNRYLLHIKFDSQILFLSSIQNVIFRNELLRYLPAIGHLVSEKSNLPTYLPSYAKIFDQVILFKLHFIFLLKLHLFKNVFRLEQKHKTNEKKLQVHRLPRLYRRLTLKNRRIFSLCTYARLFPDFAKLG